MKKKYLLTCIYLLTGMISFHVHAEEQEPTFVITHMIAPEGGSGVVYRGSKSNAEIQVSVERVRPLQRDFSINMPCIGEVEASTANPYPYLEMEKDNAATNDPSFIEIKNLGDAYIEKVRFAMASSYQTSILVCGISLDGTLYLDENYVWPIEGEKGGELISQRITLNDGAGLCEDTYVYEVPDKADIVDWDMGEVTGTLLDIRKKVKTIRLNWGGIFAGQDGSLKGRAADIFAISVYTNADDDGTGIADERSNSAVKISVYGRNMQLSERADVIIYDIAGNAVAEYKGIEYAYLDMLNAGVYITKMKGEKGQVAVQKVIVK